MIDHLNPAMIEYNVGYEGIFDSPTAQKAIQWGKLGLVSLQIILLGTTGRSPPVNRPRTREAIHLVDSDEPRCIVINCL